MKITMESTEQLTTMDGVPVRVWKGVTERGVQCFVFVHRVAVHPNQDATQFEQELKETLEPGQAIPLRMVLS